MEEDLSNIPVLGEQEYLKPVDAIIEEAVIDNVAHKDQVSDVVDADPAEFIVQNSGKNFGLAEGIEGVVQQIEPSENGSIQDVMEDNGEEVLLGEVAEDSSEKLHSVVAKPVHNIDNNKDCLFEDGKFHLPSKSIQQKKKLNKDFGPIKGSLRGRKISMLGVSDGFTLQAIT
ncbi:hypothetical protein MA16_Dca003032 [Dendrobium catenatum]|uniref:Uncharacterized protein n=1 Tax=Dendrobium catenatum TaxID=906689 RepID=A0A2I0X9C2_9ASPA|nr:hypothetical protein MA16_Dca003032 [Dendrobium catenatum]